MNRRYLLSLSSVLYFVSLCAVSAMLANALNLITFAHGEKIFTGFLVVLSGYGAAVLRAFSYENKNREKIIKHQILFTFIFTPCGKTTSNVTFTFIFLKHSVHLVI